MCEKTMNSKTRGMKFLIVSAFIFSGFMETRAGAEDFCRLRQPQDRTDRWGSGDSILEISALSRPLHLGTLYNAQNDQLVPGFSIWKTEDIDKATRVKPQHNTSLRVAGSESFSEKIILLEISASVKLSFFCGLIKAGGSAHYLKSNTSSTRQCSVTLRYHKSTEYKELRISQLDSPNAEILEKTDATHVVVGVLYGADAIMEFQQTASNASDKKEIQGNLNVMIKNIPSLEISGDGSLKMDDDYKKKVQNFSCRFFGDFDLKENPSTFEEAVKVYKELPTLLGEKGEKAVPVKVWLYPLSRFNNTESKLKTMISEALVSEVEKVMDDFQQAEMRTNDLLEKSKGIKTADVVNKLEQFQSSLKVFTVEFLKKMAALIPEIRGGTLKETTLKDLLMSLNKSSFSGREMKQWLDGKDTEIDVVMKYIIKIQDYTIKPPGPELDSFLMDPDVTDAFVFSFTSLKYEEPYLKKISQAAENFRSGSTSGPAEQDTTVEVPWYKNESVKEVLDSTLRMYITNNPSKKVISFISDPEHPGASIRWYKEADLKDPHVTGNLLNICSGDSILEISALSRPLHLGTLYNARNDLLIPGFSIWKTEDIDKATRVKPQHNTSLRVAGSESFSEKIILLEISASVKLSFFCGLIKAGGSAHYLKSNTSSTRQCSVTLRYHKSTEYKELRISQLDSPNAEILEKTDATHVVVGVLYGADAIMEFQQTASNASDKKEIQGNLNVMIKNIPSLEISGDGSLKMDDDYKKKVQNFSCRFFGDFDLKENPSTFEEAVKVYKELPTLLGEKGEKAVPVKVRLYPLSRFNNTESKLKTMISEALVSEVEKVMDDFQQAEMRTNDLLEKSKGIKAADVVNKLEQFQSSLKVFTVEFLKKMAALIPEIRGGTLKETTLKDLMMSLNKSSFSGREMKQWLDGKDTEIDVVMKYIIKIQDYTIKPPGPELDSFLMDPDVTDAFVFSFTSLKYEEPYLKKISQAAENFRNGSTSGPAEQDTTVEVPWYKNESVKEVLDSTLRMYITNNPSKKVISFISDPEHPGASIRWYKEAALKDPHVTGNLLNICNQTCALCGKRWTLFGVKCYYFSTDKLNWMMSRDYCTEKGGRLVIITSKEEHNFVSSRPRETHWMGLNDLETEGKWMWVNKKSLADTGITFWYKPESGSGEPDNWKVVDSSGENCAALGDENGNIDKWFDASCQKMRKYICEK